MLPDFPSLKFELQKVIVARLRHRVDTGDPVFSQVRKFVQHEGTQMQIQRHGQETVREGYDQIGAEFTVPIEDVPNLIGRNLDAKLEEIAQKLISKSAQAFFKKLDESCDRAGMSFDAGGSPLSPETLLSMIEKLDMDFDADGRPTQTFVLHPDMLPGFKKVMEQIENDSELKRRYSEILARQREAWADRENNRKLVD